MERLTLQAYIQHQWQDVAVLTFPLSDKKQYRTVELDYLRDYALEHLEQDDHHAVSLNFPVLLFTDNFGIDGQHNALRFLDDIIPSGASRRFWSRFLDIEALEASEQDFILLKYGTLSPIGNLRIKESLPEPSKMAEQLYFTVEDVNNRASDFLDYAQQRGAAAGGATGAGGEAPKLLVRCSKENRIWIDAYQDDPKNHDLHYLVKYPRGARSEVDCNILRSEFIFYHELTEMGFDTIPTDNMRLEEGLFYPSLWLPRFDVNVDQHGKLERVAMESVYSILGKSAGSALDHAETLRTLIARINTSYMVQSAGFDFDISEFVIEWVRRDLLNILFGNSDNHGRNTALIRFNQQIKLAPIYDFAPMKADPEGIARTMKWHRNLESGGEYNFVGIAESLSDLLPADDLLSALHQTAAQCLDLKVRLAAKGLPEQILTMPSIGFDYIPEKLRRWGLL